MRCASCCSCSFPSSRCISSIPHLQRSPTVELDELQPEDFESLLGRAVSVEVPGGTVDCELTEVRRLPAHSLRVHPPFALILRGPRDRPLAQGMYALLHPEHGRL